MDKVAQERFRFMVKWIKCPSCKYGDLFRTNDGADNISEKYFGRRVLECSQCHKKVSIRVDSSAKV